METLANEVLRADEGEKREEAEVSRELEAKDFQSSFSQRNVSQLKCKFAIIDTGAFIRLHRIEKVCEKSFIPPQVAAEIRDAKARRHVGSFPAMPEIRVPTEKDRKWAKHFAQLTGDLGFLSDCDIEVIALTYMLHRQHGDSSKLKTSPAPVINRLADVRGPTASGAESKPSPLEIASVPDDAGDADCATSQSWSTSPNLSTEKFQAAVEGGDLSKAPVLDDSRDTAHNEAPKSENSDSSEVHFEDGDGEGEWVTPENFHLLDVTTEEGPPLDVACMTTDFSMQNVLIQMGLDVITIDGYRVKSVKLWSLLCRACGATTRETTKHFCSSCGHQPMDRVPVTVDANTAEVQIHDNRKRRNLRGSIFSIPKTRGGRNCKDLVLAEDQLLMGARMREYRYQQRLWAKECAEKDPFNVDAAYEQRGWWSRRHLPSGKTALKSAPRLETGCKGNPNSVGWHKRGGFKR